MTNSKQLVNHNLLALPT